MGFKPLSWYCKPGAYTLWGKVIDSAFGSYTPCVIDSLVITISHLVLLGLCLYRIWLIKNKNSNAQRFLLRSNHYNYLLGLLAAYSTADPFMRWLMGISLFNLGNQTGFAPFEVGFLSVFLFLINYVMFLILIWDLVFQMWCIWIRMQFKYPEILC